MTARAKATRSPPSSSSGAWARSRPWCATPTRVRALAKTRARPPRGRSSLIHERLDSGDLGRARGHRAERRVARALRTERRVEGAAVEHLDQANGRIHGCDRAGRCHGEEVLPLDFVEQPREL